MELTKEDVLHVAYLARVSINENEVEKYQKQLNQILDMMKKINDVNLKEEEILISPSENKNVYREDIPFDEEGNIHCAPKTNGNYIEIETVVNE